MPKKQKKFIILPELPFPHNEIKYQNLLHSLDKESDDDLIVRFHVETFQFVCPIDN